MDKLTACNLFEHLFGIEKYLEILPDRKQRNLELVHISFKFNGGDIRVNKQRKDYVMHVMLCYR